MAGVLPVNSYKRLADQPSKVVVDLLIMSLNKVTSRLPISSKFFPFCFLYIYLPGTCIGGNNGSLKRTCYGNFGSSLEHIVRAGWLHYATAVEFSHFDHPRRRIYGGRSQRCPEGGKRTDISVTVLGNQFSSAKASSVPSPPPSQPVTSDVQLKIVSH